MKPVSFGAVLLAFLGTLAWPNTARADQRDDLTALGEGAAHRAAESIACTSPKARQYFGLTLRNVAERRWGLVADTMQADTIDLVADAVYEEARRGSVAGPGDALTRFVGAPSATCSDLDLARRTIAAGDSGGERTLTETCAAKPLVSRRVEPACSLALATRAALDRQPDVAIAHVAEIIAAAAFDAIFEDKSFSEAERDALYDGTVATLEEILLSRSEETIDREIDHVLRGLEPRDVQGCKDGDLLHALAGAASGGPETFCAATRADLSPDKVPVSLAGPGESEAVDLDAMIRIVRAGIAEGHGHLSDDHAGELVLCALASSAKDRPYVDCSGGSMKSTKAATYKLRVGTESWAIAIAPKGTGAQVTVTSPERLGLVALVSGAEAALHARYDFASLVETRFNEVPRPSALRPLAASMFRIRQLAHALHDAKVEHGDHDYLLGYLDALGRLTPHRPGQTPKPLACAAPTDPVERIRCVIAGGARDLLVAAEERRTRELSVRAATLVQPVVAEQPCMRKASGRLLTALAAYVPEGEEQARSGDLVDRQLASAAADVASCGDAHGSSSPIVLDVASSLGLRASWNGAYVNAWGADGFRVVPSFDVLAMRVRLTSNTSHVRLALHASAIDPFAPLVELAMRRPDLDYDAQGLVWLDAIRPRVELGVSAPSISKHLVVVAGASMRMSAPFVGSVDPASPKPASSATYLTPFDSAPARSEHFSHFVETNVGAKYVF